MEAILITSTILLIAIIVISIRIYKARRKEAIRRWCVMLNYQLIKSNTVGFYTSLDIEKMAEFLIKLPNKKLKCYKEILPLTEYYKPYMIVNDVNFITQGTSFPKPPE